jgi:hypothetical protein
MGDNKLFRGMFASHPFCESRMTSPRVDVASSVVAVTDSDAKEIFYRSV